MLQELSAFFIDNAWSVSASAGCALAGFCAARVVGRTRTADHDGAMLNLVLTNMSQGLCVFDGNQRLVVCNNQYAEMYGLPPELAQPGTTLIQVLDFRVANGDYTGNDPKAYIARVLDGVAKNEATVAVRELKNGRVLHTTRKPLDDGGWIATHEDVTERHKAGQQQFALAEQEKRRTAIENAIANFRESVDGVLGSVGGSVGKLKSTGEILSTCSQDTSQRATGAVHASRNASESICAASGAAEELLNSIAEINGQLRAAADLVQTALLEAHTMNKGIVGLAEAAQEIGNIVQVIQTIAGQTNLLALNATIEAARAGDAGRGFSVVASEVKSLAVQTAKATEQIVGQIAAVQTATAGAVEAIHRNTERMQEINRHTDSISTSVELQNAATNRISQNVTNATTDTTRIITLLTEVDGAAAETHTSAQTVLSVSESVETAALRLREKIERFLNDVAA